MYCVTKSSISGAGVVHSSLSFKSDSNLSISKSLNDLRIIDFLSIAFRVRDKVKHNIKWSRVGLRQRFDLREQRIGEDLEFVRTDRGAEQLWQAELVERKIGAEARELLVL